MSCPSGLLWNPTAMNCDWAVNVKCSTSVVSVNKCVLPSVGYTRTTCPDLSTVEGCVPACAPGFQALNPALLASVASCDSSGGVFTMANPCVASPTLPNTCHLPSVGYDTTTCPGGSTVALCMPLCALGYVARAGPVPVISACEVAGGTFTMEIPCVPGLLPAPSPIGALSGKYQGIYLKTWAGGWSEQGILDMFTPVNGYGDVAFVTFFNPVPSGLDCSGQSPCTTVWSSSAGANVPASTVYKTAITNSYSKYGVRTLLALGGWTYRDNFGFLATMSSAQLSAWALQVKAWVDRFGAHGIDIDYEAETAAQWQNELVKTNALHYLRVAMPAGQYIITFTIGGLAAVIGTPAAVQASFRPPLSQAYASSGIALSTLRVSWTDVDRVQLMTYDGEPNLDPRVCLNLTVQAIAGFGVAKADAAAKLLIGAELGSQYGGCAGTAEGWCLQDDKVIVMASYVVATGYGGFFYWSNLEAAGSEAIYKSTYTLVHSGSYREGRSPREGSGPGEVTQAGGWLIGTIVMLVTLVVILAGVLAASLHHPRLGGYDRPAASTLEPERFPSLDSPLKQHSEQNEP